MWLRWSAGTFDEHRSCWGELVSVEKLFHNTFEASHTASLQLGVPDGDPDGVAGSFGLYLENATLAGEEDVGEDGLGGDGKVAQGTTTQPGNGSRPRDEVTGFASAGKFHRELSFVRRFAHAVRVYSKSGVYRKRNFDG